MTKTRSLLIVAAVTIVAVLLGVYAPLSGQNPTGSGYGFAGSGCKALAGYITVIQDSSGFNGSMQHKASFSNPWPIITVHKGDTVRILICNADKVASHGFAIDHYFDGGVTLTAGQSYKVSFVADQPGKFFIFCNVFCPVHIYMVSQLIVTA